MERGRDRQTDRDRDTERDTERERSGVHFKRARSFLKLAFKLLHVRNIPPPNHPPPTQSILVILLFCSAAVKTPDQCNLQQKCVHANSGHALSPPHTIIIVRALSLFHTMIIGCALRQLNNCTSRTDNAVIVCPEQTFPDLC